MLIQHLLFVFLVVVRPLQTYTERRRADSVKRREDRIRDYTTTITWKWTAVVLLLITVGWRDLYYADLPDELGPLPGQAFFASVTMLGCVPVFVVHLLAWVKPDRRTALAAHLRHLDWLLPQTGRERRLWAAAALTAGLCEEILFRGFLIDYLHEVLSLSAAWSWALSSLLFGLGHAYQGRAAVILTALFGAAMGMVFVQYGSLLVPMVVHALWGLRILLVFPRISVDRDR